MSARELTRVEVLSRVKAGTLRLGSAATLLAVSYRQGKRLARRYRAEGAKGLQHRGTGGASNHARPAAERAQVLALVREKYSGHVRIRHDASVVSSYERLLTLLSADGRAALQAYIEREKRNMRQFVPQDSPTAPSGQ